MKHLRHAAIFLTAFALAGCKFEVTPDSFDLSADVGQTVTESIEVRNTGDELVVACFPVQFSLALDGAPLMLSETAGVLQPGESANIDIGRVRSGRSAWPKPTENPACPQTAGR